ncbi:hypothetical protein B0A52_06948 [Exophiala mesophila]|uniref:ABM domain-containing protein n=1 Tax=Exophiala mesophila TaxID=212818 RepID=A0A438N1B9_EXOME|nr:hypothetical protein B0A52_06948 [Exophiala mesophila]
MSSSQKPLALMAIIHPKTEEKREQILSLLPKSFFRAPATNCTTWCYLSPSTRKGALKGLLPPSSPPVIIGLEIYTSPASLGYVQNASEFKSFMAQVESQDLYAKDEDQTAWYPTAGFLARSSTQTPPAGLAVLAKFVAKDGAENTKKLVEVLGNYCNWVRDNEPTTLTYCVLTRPKAPNEVLLFERYQDLAAIGAHGKTKEFKNMFKGTGPYLQGKLTRLEEFEEIDGSFVSNQPGGGASQPKL